MNLDLRGEYVKLDGKKVGRVLKWEFEDGKAVCRWRLYKSAAATVNRALKEVHIWEVGEAESDTEGKARGEK
jgi:Cu/Zn superoxide dismutase